MGRRPNRIAAVVQSVLPPDRAGDELAILTGAGLNVIGLVVAVIATFGSQVLLARTLGADAYGVVYLTTQVAFVGAAFTRFGMDMAGVREVAIAVGAGEAGRARHVVSRAVLIAAGVSAAAAAGLFLLAGPLAGSGPLRDATLEAYQAAALALPFVALAQVYLGGTRGLKTMTPTLLVYWAGQPVAWVLLIAIAFAAFHPAAPWGTLAYAGSWILATAGAALWWRRLSGRFEPVPAPPGELRRLLRFGAPRAPAALFAQLLFVLDLFVLAAYVPEAEYGVYAAAARVSLLVVLFLTSVALVFSPFVADLHARGERERLGSLFQLLTRATFALTLPVILALLVLPEPVLRLFGGEFSTAGAHTALLVLVAGQTVNVAVGSVGFVMVMVGRTGWDALVYAASIALDLALAFWLIPEHGILGAAIAQAVTLTVSNALRVWLVWRFVGIQPFSRAYALLLVPAAAGAAAMAALHLILRGGSWPVDLVVSAAGGAAVYLVALGLAGLPMAERMAVRRVLTGLRGRPADTPDVD